MNTQAPELVIPLSEIRQIAVSGANAVLTYAMDEPAHAALLSAEAEALEAIASHAATVRRLSAELRLSKAETARLRAILKHRGIRA